MVKLSERRPAPHSGTEFSRRRNSNKPSGARKMTDESFVAENSGPVFIETKCGVTVTVDAATAERLATEGIKKLGVSHRSNGKINHVWFCQDGKQINLHRWIMDAKPGEIVHYLNGDITDNRRDNLFCGDNSRKAHARQSRFC